MGKPPTQKRKPRGVRKTARHRIRNAIASMILEGRVPPGAKLVQLELSRRFGVSLGMIREVLFELEGSGLVESWDNHGVYVRSADARTLHEFQVIRELFDGIAARECCGHLTQADATALRVMAERIYALTKAGQFEEKNLLDRELHLRIAELAGNHLLLTLARQHHALGKVFGGKSEAERTLAGHLAIIEAIARNDPDAAEQAARQHLREAMPAQGEAKSDGGGDIQWVT